VIIYDIHAEVILYTINEKVKFYPCFFLKLAIPCHLFNIHWSTTYKRFPCIVAFFEFSDRGLRACVFSLTSPDFRVICIYYLIWFQICRCLIQDLTPELIQLLPSSFRYIQMHPNSKFIQICQIHFLFLMSKRWCIKGDRYKRGCRRSIPQKINYIPKKMPFAKSITSNVRSKNLPHSKRMKSWATCLLTTQEKFNAINNPPISPHP